VIQVHEVFARAIILYFAALGIWGLFLAVRKSGLSSAYRGALVIGVVLAIVQGLIGIVLFASGGRPKDDLHYLYGLSLVVVFPLVQQYISKRNWSQVLVYGIAALFAMGLGIRAITTGS
jgi:heme A synthase